MLAEIYSTGIIPTAEKLGKVILLPKDDNWSGDISRLRPITLLESLRKIIEAILQMRLQEVISKSFPFLVATNGEFQGLLLF
jgi:hypothetical protein